MLFRSAIAAHSLGTMYVYSEFDDHRDNMSDIYFYNPASSPLQDTDMLHEYANDPGVHYHINQGDVVSHGRYQQMDDVTVDAQVTLRSEERRVGNERRSRWAPNPSKNKHNSNIDPLSQRCPPLDLDLILALVCQAEGLAGDRQMAG